MSTPLDRKWRVITVVGVVALVAVAIAFFALRGCGSGDDEASSSDNGGHESAVDDLVRVSADERPAPATGLKRGFSAPIRPQSGPMRFVARYGESRRRPDAGARSQDEARQLAESARRRLLDGEDPTALIRQLSDPPIGIPAEILEQGASIGPGEASAVLELRDGYVVFYRAPASEEAPDSEEP